MGFYERHILPVLIARGMENKVMTKHRPRVAPQARGRVLEVGAGSGVNLPWYPDEVETLFALEPLPALRDKIAERAEAASFPVELIDAGAEDIPLDTASVDTVVSTWTLCSIPSVEAALQEIRRVLKKSGKLLFIEHGRAPDAGVAKWQDRLAPMLRCCAGCNPNRQIDTLIESASFEFSTIERAYFDGPRFISYHFVGQAEPQ